ncbi:MAG: hypothetical protein C0417_08865 [Chlorobiaceae bacterium]|nr:hypothetical protein [Chlorobiaceae bacterium]
MFKWDKISWIASGIFLAGLLLGAFVNELFLYLMVGGFLLRSTLLAFGVAKIYADERQMQIQYHSGNIALTVLVVAIIIFAVKAGLSGKQAFDEYAMLVTIALVAKGVVGLVMIGDYRAVAVRITVIAGVAITLFASLSHGFSLGTLMEASPGLLIIIVGLLGIKRPMISAALLAIIGLATFIFFGPGGGLTETRIFMGIILSLPLFVTAFCFYKGARIEKKN